MCLNSISIRGGLIENYFTVFCPVSDRDQSSFSPWRALEFLSTDPLGLICNEPRPRDQETTGSGDENGALAVNVLSTFEAKDTWSYIGVKNSPKSRIYKRRFPSNLVLRAFSSHFMEKALGTRFPINAATNRKNAASIRGWWEKNSVQLSNLHHPRCYLSKIRETLEPVKCIIFTNEIFTATVVGDLRKVISK